MCSACRGHGKSKQPLPEARGRESKSRAGVSWDAIPQKLQREERENRRMVGRSCLRPHCTAGMLIPHHHPKPGLKRAPPFWVQDAPPCSARHETAAWHMVSTAAEIMLQAKGKFQEEKRRWEPLGEIQDKPKPLPGKTKGPVPQEQLHLEDRPNTTAPGHGEKGLFCAWGKGTNTQSTRPSGGALRRL